MEAHEAGLLPMHAVGAVARAEVEQRGFFKAESYQGLRDATPAVLDQVQRTGEGIQEISRRQSRATSTELEHLTGTGVVQNAKKLIDQSGTVLRGV